MTYSPHPSYRSTSSSKHLPLATTNASYCLTASFFDMFFFSVLRLAVLYKYSWYPACQEPNPQTVLASLAKKSTLQRRSYAIASLLSHLTSPPYPFAASSTNASPCPLSQMHRRQTQNLTPLFPPQLLTHQTRQATPDRLAALVDQHAGVVVEFHHAAVRARVFFGGPHDHGVTDVAAAHFVRCADGHAAARARFGAEVALFLHDDYYAVAWRDGS
jgi:hypothetical protein